MEACKNKCAFHNGNAFVKVWKALTGKKSVCAAKFAIIKARIFPPFSSPFSNSCGCGKLMQFVPFGGLRRVRAEFDFFYANLLTGNEAEMGAHR